MPRWWFVIVLVPVLGMTALGQGTAKYEPPDGQVYHGAFAVSQHSTNPGDYWLDVSTFENLANKHLAIVLWYADWSANFQNSIGNIINQNLKPGGRVIEVGWMPSGVPIGDIANGLWDAYLQQWFTDARNNGEPIFLRFANEMNGCWVDYDGWHNGGSISTELGWQATETYKAAWRRVYAIARQMHACNVAFVWAPNYTSWPDPSLPQYAWNHWRNYYPGDEYVDWVGVDVYDFEGWDPRDSIRPFYEEYAARKPIMFAETAGHYETAVGADKERYIGQLFSAMETAYPRIKAFVWFNYQEPARNWRMEETPASLAAYQSRVANSRYVGTISRTMADTIKQPSAQSVCPGGTAAFTVAIVGGTFGYQWQKNSTNLTNGGHYSGTTTATLTVSNVDTSDAAGYRCIVTGGCVGSTTSNEAALTLRAATSITQQPTDIAVVWGQAALFSVSATGDGTLRYQWQKNSSNITNGGHYSGCKTATLAVSSCDSNDAADYRCVVASGCGIVPSNTATLTVGPKGPPGDFDHDGDVDQQDFGVLQNCLGVANPSANPICAPVNLKEDNAINGLDVDMFKGCMSGSTIPGNDNCASGQ
jgi:beta-mannanase